MRIAREAWWEVGVQGDLVQPVRGPQDCPSKGCTLPGAAGWLAPGWSWPTEPACLPAALFCDYYNPEGQCEWHYQPCGAPCMRTCRNPGGRCLHDLRGLEGRLLPRWPEGVVLGVLAPLAGLDLFQPLEGPLWKQPHVPTRLWVRTRPGV